MEISILIPVYKRKKDAQSCSNYHKNPTYELYNETLEESNSD